MKRLRQQLLRGRLLLLKYDRPRLACSPERGASRSKWLRRAFFLLQCFLQHEDLPRAMVVIDQLKLAYADGFARSNESMRLTALLISFLKEKRVNMAAFLFDAFTPMMRGQSVERLVALFEELTFISLVAVKNRHFFLCAKVTAFILDFFEKSSLCFTETGNQHLMITGVAALKRIGSLTIRRDPALFHEILTRTVTLLEKHPGLMEHDEIHALFSEWIYKAARNEQPNEMICVLNELERLRCYHKNFAVMLRQIIKETENVAGNFSYYLQSPICALLVQKLLALAYLSHSSECMRRAIQCASKVGYLAVYQHGFRESFSLLLPLFDSGRRMFNDERKFGYSESNNGFRQKSLLVILKESLAIAEYAVRQDMTFTVSDFILWMLETWQKQASIEHSKKSIKRFSQLFYLYWCQVRRRQAKQSADLLSDVMSPVLVTNEQVQELFE